jgi:hypothetical protein
MADLPEKVIDVRIRAREAMEGLSMGVSYGAAYCACRTWFRLNSGWSRGRIHMKYSITDQYSGSYCVLSVGWHQVISTES